MSYLTVDARTNFVVTNFVLFVEACVISVSVGFWEQRKTRDGIFGVLPTWKVGREPKMKDMGGEGEGRKRLQTNPWILKTSARQPTGLMIGWASRTLLACVDQRS